MKNTSMILAGVAFVGVYSVAAVIVLAGADDDSNSTSPPPTAVATSEAETPSPTPWYEDPTHERTWDTGYFEDGDYFVTESGIKVRTARYFFDYETVIRTENISNDTQSPWIEVILLSNNGTNIVAVYDCIGNEFEPGQTQRIECYSGDNIGNYNEIRVVDAF